jgi:cell division protein FtsZ
MLDLTANLQEIKFEMADDLLYGTRIKVIGVGGGGSNAVARMMRAGLGGVEFYVINTDQQALNSSPVPNKLAIGGKMTRGLGAGSNPQIGYEAALEDTERIIEILEGADMVFVTAGLGGGTGTGAAPVVASLSKGLNALTVAVVTKPFSFEGPRRSKLAEMGLGQLAQTVDTVISIPNSRLLDIVPRGTSIMQSFEVADDVLMQAVQGISDIITTPGLINRDFSDVRAIMVNMGYAMMGTASAKGENAALEAAKKAIDCPLLDGAGVKGAKGILINITSSSELQLHDVDEACSLIRDAAQFDDLQLNFGVVLDESMGDEVKMTVIATGFDRDGAPAMITMPQVDRSRMDPYGGQAAQVAAPAPVEPTITERPVETLAPAMEEAAVEFENAIEATPEDGTPVEDETAELEQPMPLNDLDTPAFLRRDRRMFQ